MVLYDKFSTYLSKLYFGEVKAVVDNPGSLPATGTLGDRVMIMSSSRIVEWDGSGWNIIYAEDINKNDYKFINLDNTSLYIFNSDINDWNVFSGGGGSGGDFAHTYDVVGFNHPNPLYRGEYPLEDDLPELATDEFAVVTATGTNWIYTTGYEDTGIPSNATCIGNYNQIVCEPDRTIDFEDFGDLISQSADPKVKFLAINPQNGMVNSFNQQIQSDWTQNNNNAKDYIKHRIIYIPYNPPNNNGTFLLHKDNTGACTWNPFSPTGGKYLGRVLTVLPTNLSLLPSTWDSPVEGDYAIIQNDPIYDEVAVYELDHIDTGNGDLAWILMYTIDTDIQMFPANIHSVKLDPANPTELYIQLDAPLNTPYTIVVSDTNTGDPQEGYLTHISGNNYQFIHIDENSDPIPISKPYFVSITQNL